MVWFNCAAIKLRVGRGVGVQILAEMRDFSLLHDVHIGSGTLLASWFVGWEGEGKGGGKVFCLMTLLFCLATLVLFKDAVVLFNDAVVLFNDALCC
jgi:hypothetical protein